MGYFNNRDSNVVMGPGTGAASFAYATELKGRIIWYDVSITPLRGVFGRQSFPFSVVLPEVLPPSMEVGGEILLLFRITASLRGIAMSGVIAHTGVSAQ